MSNRFEDWDHICFCLIFWATFKWPWEQPWCQFCYLLIGWHAFCVGPVVPTSAFASKPSPVSCIKWGIYTLYGQTFKHRSSSTSLHLSPLTLSISEKRFWAAFLEKPWQSVLATASGIFSQAAYKQNDNENGNPKLQNKWRQKADIMVQLCL